MEPAGNAPPLPPRRRGRRRAGHPPGRGPVARRPSVVAGCALLAASAVAPASAFQRPPVALGRRAPRHRPTIDSNFASPPPSSRNGQLAGISPRCSLTLPSLAASRTSDDAVAAPPGLGDLERLETLAEIANDALDAHGSEVLKTFAARVAVIPPDDFDDDFQQKYLRLGLVATEPLKDGQLVASLPFNDSNGSGLALAPHLASKVVYKKILPEGYDGWTGDVGLLAMLLLNEMARLNMKGGTGIDLPRRKDGPQELMAAWVATLPSPEEMEALHPLMWDEDGQETLQSSSTKKVYRLLDDIDDDASWLDEKLWSADRTAFPAMVRIQIGEELEERPCFSPDGFRYAASLVRSRACFVDGALRLLPYLDYANHADYDAYEIRDGSVGRFGISAKGALLKSGKRLPRGAEVLVSYGPKGPADYLLDHGFVPPMCRATSSPWGGTGASVAAELAFELDDADRFRDDKLDILEYETYDLAPMDPQQSFDVVGGPGATGEPDPAMVQFLRLVKMGGKDAFLLESIFRKEVWGFVGEPVSEDNERAANAAVSEACAKALGDMLEGDGGGDESEPESLCAMVRGAEREALERTLAFAKQEAEALDLKEYYQERRLKSLGLDSEWAPEDMGWGSSGRVPGGADYDW